MIHFPVRRVYNRQQSKLEAGTGHACLYDICHRGRKEVRGGFQTGLTAGKQSVQPEDAGVLWKMREEVVAGGLSEADRE